MARADGRIEPGQPLGAAISARAWNRAQDAADLVLGANPGVGFDDTLSQMRLPCVTAKLSRKSAFGQVVVLREAPSLPSGETQMLTGSINTSEQSEFTAGEKRLISFSVIDADVAGDGSEENDADIFNRSFAIGIGNNSHVHAISGLAFVRVRFWQMEHRHARLARVLNDYYSFELYNDQAGILDSCFWGPARIIGYCAYNQTTKQVSLYHRYPFAQGEIRWALVKF